MIEQLVLYFSIGWSVGQLVRFLDFLMDFGHPLSRLRYFMAKRAAKKVGMVEWIKKRWHDANNMAFHDAIESMDKAYWDLASMRHPFTPWICRVCMGARLALVSAIVGSFFVSMPLLYVLISFSMTFYIINK